jgi:hypothetical protein
MSLGVSRAALIDVCMSRRAEGVPTLALFVIDKLAVNFFVDAAIQYHMCTT